MTIDRTLAPPPPSDPTEASACADPLVDGSVWAAVRQGYEEGSSCRLLAEQYGLKDRTVREHAQRGGWRARRERHRAAKAPQRPIADSVAEALAEHRESRQVALLTDPTAASSLTYIAGLIQDSLVRCAPHETRLWQKAFADLKRDAADMDRAFNGGLDPADILRRIHIGDLLAAERAEPAPATDEETD